MTDLKTKFDNFLLQYPQWTDKLSLCYGALAYYGDTTEYLDDSGQFVDSSEQNSRKYDSSNEGLYEGKLSDIETIKEIAKNEHYFDNGIFYLVQYIMYPQGFISFIQENEIFDSILEKETIERIY
jgi:hypothetical protein